MSCNFLWMWERLVLITYCSLCALRRRNMLRSSQASGGGMEQGTFAGLGHPAESACLSSILHSTLPPPDINNSHLIHHLTATPHQAILKRRQAWCPTILVSNTLPHSCILPSTLRDDILEFCNANGSSLPLSGGRYETICGLT
jgi:hypothetical protein